MQEVKQRGDREGEQGVRQKQYLRVGDSVTPCGTAKRKQNIIK